MVESLHNELLTYLIFESDLMKNEPLIQFSNLIL